MRIWIDHSMSRDGRYGRPCGCCSLCGRTLVRGEAGWYLNGQNICADCFLAFARAELAPYETVFGMEAEA